MSWTIKNVLEFSPNFVELILPAIVPGKTIIVLIQNGHNIEKPIFDALPNIFLSGVSMIIFKELELGVIDQDKPERC